MSQNLSEYEIRIPKIYAYTDSRYPNCLKVGYTTKSVQERVKEQYPVKLPNQSYQIVLDENAVRENGTFFRDSDVHKLLLQKGVERLEGEWFQCDVNTLKAVLLEVKTGKAFDRPRSLNFGMRPEQQNAVDKAMNYFKQFTQDPLNKDKIPHFLWNAKMRFGKTFASYQLMKKMGWKKVLVLTFKPAVQNAWQEDLENHTDFNGWKFVTDGSQWQSNAEMPQVCFGSFQDYLGKNKFGGIKLKNEWVHAIHWDCVIFDECHYGVWREKAKGLFAKEELEQENLRQAEEQEMELVSPDYFDEDLLPITTNHYLYLSGTPFRAINSGEFIEEQIFNWTYSDEQKAKAEWQGENNPYLSLPRMMMFTYQLPDDIREVALKGEFSEFDLNVFFSATGEGEKATFKYENEVQKWLDLIRSALRETTVDNLKLGADKPPMPFGDTHLLNSLLHTFWFLPSVASCYAMQNLLLKPHNKFYHDYQIIVCAGNAVGLNPTTFVLHFHT